MDNIQLSSVAQSCPTLCNPMNRSTPGLPVRHQLPEFTQTQVHRVSDAIQPSVGAKYATRDQWRNNSRKNEVMEQKHKQHSVVNGTGDGSRV